MHLAEIISKIKKSKNIFVCPKRSILSENLLEEAMSCWLVARAKIQWRS